MDQQSRDMTTRAAIALLQGTLSDVPVDASKGSLSGGFGNTPIGQNFVTAPVAPTAVVYPAYNSPAADARDSRTGDLIPPHLCCSYSEALAVMSELKGTDPQVFLPNVVSITPGTLGRMPFCITLPKSSKPGLMFNCETFRIAKKSHGDGAPYTADADGQVHFPVDNSGRPTDAWTNDGPVMR